MLVSILECLREGDVRVRTCSGVLTCAAAYVGVRVHLHVWVDVSFGVQKLCNFSTGFRAVVRNIHLTI